MVKPDIHTLAHHLKQERLYVASEKQLIQRLNNDVLKTAEKLYQAAWIAKQQRINLDRLILTRSDLWSPTAVTSKQVINKLYPSSWYLSPVLLLPSGKKNIFKNHFFQKHEKTVKLKLFFSETSLLRKPKNSLNRHVGFEIKLVINNKQQQIRIISVWLGSGKSLTLIFITGLK